MSAADRWFRRQRPKEKNGSGRRLSLEERIELKVTTRARRREERIATRKRSWEGKR